MDPPNFAAPRPLGAPQSNQAEWLHTGVSDLSIQNLSYEPRYGLQETAPQVHVGHSAYFPPAPRPRSSVAPASLQQAGEEIEAYIHIACVKKLYESHCGLSNTVTGLSNTVTRLYAEANDLREHNERLEKIVEQQRLPGGPTNYAAYRRTVSGSLAPSDSLSQQLSRQSSGSLGESREAQGGNPPLFRTPRPQPAERPDDLPVEVLWQRDDCKLDTRGAAPKENGTPVSHSYYKAIYKSVANQVAILIQEEEEETKNPLRQMEITRRHFENARAKQWLHAIAVLEEEHPVLALAASHWKAEQLLAAQLTGKRGYKKRSKKGKWEESTKSDEQEESTNKDNTDEGQSEDGGRKEKVGAKRKRGKPAPNPSPSEAAATMAYEDTAMNFGSTETQQQQDVDMRSEPPEPPTNAVKKRLGKQAAFAAISTAALRMGRNQDESSELSSVHPPRTSPLSLITVDSTYDGIKDVFTTTFHNNTPPHALELLDALEKISKSAALNSGSPSSNVLQFIERIESADPTIPDIDPDDTDIGWGHSQFTSGSLTCRSVLQSWSDVGNVKTAYRLLAASLKTCLVARHLCFTHKTPVSNSSSYLSDAYLREVVDILWNFQPQDSVPPRAAGSMPGCNQQRAMVVPTSTGASDFAAGASTTSASHGQEPGSDLERLGRLNTQELKSWMQEHSIPMPPHYKRKKGDLINTIICAGSEKIPSDEEISHIINMRTSHKRSAATKPS